MRIIQIKASETITQLTLDIATSASMTETNSSLSAPCVWVVNPKSLATLRTYTDVIDDKGTKHPAIELSRTMLRGEKIPLIDGQYSSAGKLRNGIKILLRKADEANCRLMIIGATDEVFADLLRQAEEEPVAYSSKFTATGKAQVILSLLPLIPETPTLRDAFLGDSGEAVIVRQLILRAAAADDRVLITGDTGTGKEIVAKQIRQHSRRSQKPFIAVNCSAIPRDLFESELFGHVKGAFTGATEDKVGMWEEADGGTLFLDEIGELTEDNQAKLLRALEENRIKKVGGTKEIDVNARIFCATNRDLFSMVQRERFREDLYYRLREFLITTPSLSEHPSDIPILAQSIWKKISHGPGTSLPAEIVSRLTEYRWPGNVRELKMVLTHLYGLFGSISPLEERHLLAVFEMQGQSLQQKINNTVTTDRFAPFRHLRRVYELVRAIEHSLTPILSRTHTDNSAIDTISTSLQAHLNELEQLVTRPQHFTTQTFDRISLLRSRLIYFLSQPAQPPESSREYLKTQAHQAVDDALAALLGEIDGALATI